MTDLPDDESRQPSNWPADDTASPAPTPARVGAEEQPVEFALTEFTPAEPSPAAPVEPASLVPLPPASDSPFVSFAPPPPIYEPQLFQSFTQPPVRPPVRLPHFGHLSLLIPIGGIAFACTVAALFFPMRFHWFGWSLSTQAAANNIQLILASEAILYLIVFGISYLVFPLFWNENFFAGLQWRGAAALERFWPLAATALGCAGLALLDEVLMPGPSNAPIEKMMRTPGAAWLMFAFGTTLAPFFEEMFFRGFLLPALCTAWDWSIEQSTGKPAPPLDANGHPQWSLFAMVAASIATSIPFALLHVDQQGHSLGPFLLLIVVSLVLCTVRLKTRSLAASTLVHATYNFIIFSLALIGTGGFRHFDKM